jgi:cell wall-associated NlpC family hydrolase
MKKFTSPPINNSQLSIVWEGDPPHLTVYQFNCHNSVWYAHNGQYIAMNAGPPWPFEAWQIKKQVTQGEDLGQLDRGDIVAYYDKNGNIMHAQICTGNGKETWSANNEPPPPPGTPAQQTWKFAVSEAGKWADNVPNELKPITIKVFKKPNP